MSDLRVYDRSRVTTDWQCPRKRYWAYEYSGRGITNKGTHLELYMGTTLHDALATIAFSHAKGEAIGIDEIAQAAKQQMLDALMPAMEGELNGIEFAQEQAALVEGLVRGYHRHVWPKLIEKYPIILAIEEEMRYDHQGLTFMAKPDLILGDLAGNETVYVEYKSTSSKKEGWVNSWDTAVQLHSSIAAVKATKDLIVDKVIVQGLYKGYESYGKQNSPFCYAYRRQGNPPFSQTETVYGYKAGFKRYPSWELEGGVRGWVAGMPPDILAEQFPQTPPIFVKEDMVERFFNQRAFREHEIRMALGLLEVSDPESQQGIMDTAFPQKFDQCVPAWGKPCQYRQLCHGHVPDPLETGYWAVREPHHALELELFTEEADA